jgi:ribokinase
MDLLTVGEAFDDVVFAGLPRLPRPGEELRVPAVSYHAGGGAIITAIAAARLGIRVESLSAASDRVAAILRREGVRLLNLRASDEQPALTVALSMPRDRAFVTFEGVNRLLEPRLIDRVRQAKRLPRHVHFALGPRRCSRWVPVLQQLRKRGVTTSWDFGWHQGLTADAALPRLLAQLDWVFVNEQEATHYTAAKTITSAPQRWRALAKGTVIKRGARGAMAITQGGVLAQPTTKVRVVDTTGAGDAFNGGFLAAQLAGAPLGDCIRLGNFAGTASVRAPGGVDGLPSRARLPRWGQRLLTRS